jgi:hypothetical protein
MAGKRALTIGRIVRYTLHNGEQRPAIVVRVISETRVSLHVFRDECDPPGMAYDESIGAPGLADYSEDSEPLHWSWPPR